MKSLLLTLKVDIMNKIDLYSGIPTISTNFYSALHPHVSGDGQKGMCLWYIAVLGDARNTTNCSISDKYALLQGAYFY